MKNVEQYLRNETGYDWQEISQLYLSFRVATNPFSQICVFTPDNIGRTLRPRLYIPKECYHLHSPGVFLNDYLNAKKTLVKVMPTIQLNSDSGPKLRFMIPVPPLLFTGELSLKGHLNFKKTGSINNSIISKNSLISPVNQVREDLAALIPVSSLNMSYEGKGIVLSLQSSIKTPLGYTTVEMKDGIFSAECSPQSLNLHYKGWDIEGELGFEASGTYTTSQTSPNSISQISYAAVDNASSGLSTREKWLIGGGVVAGGGYITACVIFSVGLCAIPVAAVGLGGLVYKLAN